MSGATLSVGRAHQTCTKLAIHIDFWWDDPTWPLTETPACEQLCAGIEAVCRN